MKSTLLMANSVKFYGQIRFLFLIFLLSGFSVYADSKSSIRPNILLILCDDLGWSDLACYGADLHETPVIDRLGNESVVFKNAYSAAPVCSPTRAALMTGLHPARIPITIWSEGATKPDLSRRLIPGHSLDHLPQKYETLAEKLQKLGYRTAIVGKWHLGDERAAPETQGFEVNSGGTLWGAPPTFFWPYRNDTRFKNEFRFVPGLNFGKSGDYLTDKLTDRAIELMDSAGDQPFFLYMAHYAPHTPIEAPEDLTQKYEKRIKPNYKHQNATYAAMIENLDWNVGRLLDYLKKSDQYDNTLIIFTSDNGGYLGTPNSRNGVVTSNAPLRSGKGSVYEGGIRVPLLIKPPGSPIPKRVIEDRVVTYDLHPTVMKYAGSQELNDLDGWELKSLLTGDAAKLPDRPLYFHYPHYYETTTPVSAVISGHHKLLYYDENHRSELYDLAADPAENRDLADSEPEILNKLKNQLQQWKNEIGAQAAKPNPAYRGKS